MIHVKMSISHNIRKWIPKTEIRPMDKDMNSYRTNLPFI